MPLASAPDYVWHMEYALAEVHCPSLPAGSYLAWASWWHKVERMLSETAGDVPDPDLQIRTRTSYWDHLLEVVSGEASRAMLRREPTIEPVIRAPRSEIAAAGRIARARIAWAQATGDPALRPDANVSRLMSKLITAVDDSSGIRPFQAAT
jgi:hypothetical protein